jgi:hypothetical protein
MIYSTSACEPSCKRFDQLQRDFPSWNRSI